MTNSSDEESRFNAPQTEEQWTIHCLNIHGNFFERACQQAIKQTTNWRVTTTDYPVAVEGNQSTLDIRADMEIGHFRLVLLIECKKNNPDFSNWVFFRKANQSSSVLLPHVAPTGIGLLREVSFAQIRAAVVESGRETRANYQAHGHKHDKTRTSNTAIYDASKQISLATEAIWLEEQRRHGAFTLHGATSIVPIIVTTAKLFICDFKDQDVDPQSGEIPYDKAVLSPVTNFAVYEYPLPTYLQPTNVPTQERLDFSTMERYVRRHILIVQSAKFKHLLENDIYEVVPR